MKIRLLLKTLGACSLLLAALTNLGAAQAAAAPPQAAAAAQGACGNLPACYEATDFAVAIIDFRMSAVSGLKVMDVTLRFQNKTAQRLVLGYADGSAMAMDDQGNRFGLNGYAGANAVRGIGKVVNNQIDPKFQLQSGAVGDAMLELIWREGGVAGVNYSLDLTVREISPLEGNQYQLGGEFPLEFKGLTSGMFGNGPAGASATASGTPAVATGGSAYAAPAAGGAAATGVVATASGLAGGGAAGGLPPCPPGGSGVANATSTMNTLAGSLGSQNTQQTVTSGSTQATSAIGTATSAVGNLRTLFGKKKAAAQPANVAAAGQPCAPATAAATATPSVLGGSTAASGLAGGVATGAAQPAAGSAPAANNRWGLRPTTPVAANPAPGAAKGAASPATPAARPVAAKATLPAAKPAAQAAKPAAKPAAKKKPAATTTTATTTK